MDMEPRAVAAVRYVGELAKHFPSNSKGSDLLHTLIACAQQVTSEKKSYEAINQLGCAVREKILRYHGTPKTHDALVEILAASRLRHGPHFRESHSLAHRTSLMAISSALSYH
jgi:hypothetical protein